MIIGGVILIAILLTSVFTFYFAILNNDKAKAGYEIQSQQDSRDKELETFVVDRDIEIVSQSVAVNVNNTGSIPMVASHALLYCSSGAGCSNPGAPIQDQDITETLNPGESLPVTVGGVGAPMTSGNTYTISVISERGNIISSTTCTVQADGSCSEDSGGDGLDDDDVQGIVTEGIIQGTGTIQLDYKAFGSIYPTLASRMNVDQTGWLVNTSSSYSSVHGYPAFALQNLDSGIVMVESARNLDQSQETFQFTRKTGLMVASDQVQGTPPSANMICKENISTKSFVEYNEGANVKTLPPNPLDADNDEGWQEIYFCSTNVSDGSGGAETPDWNPANKFSELNGVFMVARGEFQNTWEQYAQTIPYQAVILGKTGLTTCLVSSNTPSSTSFCPSLTSACNSNPPCTAAASLLYTSTPSAMEVAGGLPVWLHFNSVSLPAGDNWDVSFIYPDGNITRLTDPAGETFNGNRNIPMNLPSGDTDTSDGDSQDIGDLCSSVPAGQDVYFAIVVTDEYDTSGNIFVNNLTFRMDCP